MRPRVRSYGESSTLTRSPCRTRIRNRRILPQSVAITSCPFSSATRNVVLGRTSLIVPSSSSASSFIQSPMEVLGPWRRKAGLDLRQAGPRIGSGHRAAPSSDRDDVLGGRPLLALHDVE